MRAIAVYPGERRIELTDHPEPKVAADTDVAIRILDVGVCGTDREIARFEYGTPPDGSSYLVIGHESLGEVVEVGNAVRRVKPRDLVVMTVRRPCGLPRCPACRIGRQDFCVTGQFQERGINGRHGYMTELVIEDEQYLHVVPRALRNVGVLVEPLTIAEKALIEIVQVQDRLPWLSMADTSGPRGLAVVLGAGPVGLLGALCLRMREYRTVVYSLEPDDSIKASWVRSIGAEYLSAKDVAASELGERVGNIELMYEATGASALAFQAMQALGVNGTFIFTGVPGRRGPIQIDADLIMRRLVLSNQLVYGTVNAGPNAFERAIADLARFVEHWPDAVHALITSRRPPEAYAELLTGPASGIKRVVSFALHA